ncbi:MAG TPA: hypothetical protein VMF66_10340 [Candidatus Acidoferrum sp.]|nr:hypothetical protein [Candidatus Acidoferrum sp.]
MRTAIIWAFLAVLTLICSANPAAAQSTQSAVPSQLSLVPANPFTTQTAPSVRLRPSTSDRAWLPSNLANAFGFVKEKATKSDSSSNGQWRVLPPNGRLQAKALPTAGTCAHILIHRVWSPDSNPMAIEPKGTADRMPSEKGLPPCREDIR